MEEKKLPVGSVVLLDGGVKKVMISGYFVMDPEYPNRIFDYCGCIYPEGFLSSEQSLLFNHDQIDEVCFEGYQGEEFLLFQKHLEEVSQTLKNSSSKTDGMEEL